jgi:hypothetical protein
VKPACSSIGRGINTPREFPKRRIRVFMVITMLQPVTVEWKPARVTTGRAAPATGNDCRRRCSDRARGYRPG